ncbi:Putative Mce family protein [Mycobacteroides abscessus subsp. bolletii]|uniref:MCE family protein n=1 Tax=Mycobacteroides abscessus TaxID=36809 RepID=UPI0009A90C76|nr:MlaD family protein [Mycobacteroides abscessus]SKG69307.1 Mce family protein, Mce5C [Mycobacteroides abscessus subsp. bolletii]SLF40470.1 Putative Mce family protein [Mycobacteroides abscessus subsp. bolletii]
MAKTQRWQRIRSRPLDAYNKTTVGFVAIGVVLALIAGLLLVKAAGIGYRNYHAQFLQAASLQPGNTITVAGVSVGQVTSIKLAGDHVEAGLRVQDNIKLGRDAKASIKITTILGARYLELQPGRDGTLPGQTIDLAHTQVPYDLQAALSDVTSTFEQVDADRIASSLTVLSKQIEGLPPIVPQAMDNIERLSAIVANRREQVGTLLSSLAKITSTLRRQQSGVGTFINQGQELIAEFIARSDAFHAMMRALTRFIDFLTKVVVDDKDSIDDLLKDVAELTGMLASHDDLLRSLLQIAPVATRNATNSFGSGNSLEISSTNGIVVDSWMCAISGRAKQFGMIEYFKDCK